MVSANAVVLHSFSSKSEELMEVRQDPPVVIGALAGMLLSICSQGIIPVL